MYTLIKSLYGSIPLSNFMLYSIVDPLLTVSTARRVPRVNNTDEVQTAAAGQHWTDAVKHRLSAHY